MRPLSYTQIATYQSCPLLYRLQYIDGLKPKEKGYFSFGSVLHLCAEYFFRVKVPPPPSLDELLDYYQQSWLSEGYQSAEEEENYQSYGREILIGFWRIHSADFRMPLAIEKMFYIDIDGIKLRGFIDRVDKLDSGGLSIVDYKSNQELFSSEYLGSNLQLTLYQLAAEQLWHLPVEKLTLYHLRSNTPCSCQPRQGSQLEKARRLVVEVAENIAGNRFPAVENQYCPCDFPEHCPYYRHQYMGNSLDSDRQAALSRIPEADLVERYVSLQAEIKELECQLEEVRRMIVDFCQNEGLSRVFGREHAVTYKLVEKTGFSEDMVRTLLEPEGLWGEVLSFDQSRLRQLITGDKLAEDIRQKLKALRQVISTYPRLLPKKLTDEE
ncbi:MAG: PD-(D/E)XK nuclease family protein [Dehalococcoidales bacterium]|nr:PD-(D/E)XK nuclease family protein [Dehalococcoidales bacterium]